MPVSESHFEGNLLLKSLNQADRALLSPHLDRFTVGKGETLFEAGREVAAISFPCDHTIVTLVIAMRDGRTAETATIGREGAVGAVVSDGSLPASTHAVVQIGGPVLRMDAQRLQSALQRSASLRNLFTRYSDCLIAQILQSVACNALHPIEQRCLRWLLTLQDRIGSESLPVTHELLAAMLGVQRTYLTRILRSLQEQNLVRVGRARITIVDPAEASRAACECHDSVKRHFETVLGAVYGPAGRMIEFEPPADPATRRRPEPA